MDDLYLKSRIDDALERQLEPMRPEASEILAVGRRARRRRTAVLSGVAAGALAAVLFGTTWLATSGIGSRLGGDSVEMASDPSGRPASEPTVAVEDSPPDGVTLPRTEEQLTAACSQPTVSSASADTLLFKAGQTRLVSKASNLLRAWALFESRDGKVWGSCEIKGHRTELAVFRAEADPSPPDHYLRTASICASNGKHCGVEATLLAKLPSEVTEVRINYADHYQQLRTTNDGWIAMTHLMEIPTDRPAVRRISYFNAQGWIIAEYADTSVPGVAASSAPPLTAFPGLLTTDRLNYREDTGVYTD